jgi:tRNA (uracil-5-)-methyltransferase
MDNLFAVKNKFSRENYHRQLTRKVNVFSEKLEKFGQFAIDVFESEPLGFRMRAEFRIWHEGGLAHYAMNHPGEKKPYIIDDFPIGSVSIDRTMNPLIEVINQHHDLSHRLFSAEFLTTGGGEILVTLIYHKPLDETWAQLARQLEEKLSIWVIGRSRKQKLVLSQDFVTEHIEINGVTYSYEQVESGFTQPNLQINRQMLHWANDCCNQIQDPRDLLELYCGNGNFTAVLAKNFNRVLATEISKVSVNSAKTNFRQNNNDNITVVRLSSEEITQALNGYREFRRLAGIDLSQYNFSTVFVDPPRAGLDRGTTALVQQFDQILYISCNPSTLVANLDDLCETHSIDKVAAFDQFPWTEHLEVGVLLSRRNSI